MFIFKKDYQDLIDRLDYLEEENYKLREARADSGNQHYQRDAADFMKQYHKVCRNLAEEQAKTKSLELQLEYMESFIKTHVKSSDVVRNSDGTIRSPDGITKQEKIEKMVEYREHGLTDEEIAQKLNVQKDTVRKYLSEYEKSRPKKTIEEEPWWTHTGALINGGY